MEELEQRWVLRRNPEAVVEERWKYSSQGGTGHQLPVVLCHWSHMDSM